MMEGLFHLIQMFIVLGFIVGAILLIFGSQLAGRMLFLTITLALVSPIISELLPFWVILIVILFIDMIFLQALLAFIMGRRVADLVVGNLITDIFRLVIRVIVLPLHLGRRVINMIANR